MTDLLGEWDQDVRYALSVEHPDLSVDNIPHILRMKKMFCVLEYSAGVLFLLWAAYGLLAIATGDVNEGTGEVVLCWALIWFALHELAVTCRVSAKRVIRDNIVRDSVVQSASGSEEPTYGVSARN